MPKLNPMQRNFIKALFSKMIFFPAVWFFFWAIYPLAYPRDFMIYIMLSLFNWLLFVVCLIGAVATEMILSNPALRKSLMHIERGRKDTHTTISTADKKEKKEKKLPLY